jgi:hypothetical protein
MEDKTMTNQELTGVVKLYELLDRCCKPYMINYISCKITDKICECHFLVKTKDYKAWKNFIKNNKNFVEWSSGMDNPYFDCIRVFHVCFELKQ